MLRRPLYLARYAASENKHEHKSHDFAAKKAPAHLLVRLLHEPLHVVVNLDHFLVCLFDVVGHAVQRHILLTCLRLEILGLALDHVRLCEDTVNDLVLLADVLLLLLKDLLIV
jgi:hypothetical protein